MAFCAAQAKDSTMSAPQQTVAFLKENPQRYILYPLVHHDIWNSYKTQMSCLWTAEEVDFAKDREDFDALTDEEKSVIKAVLTFFAGTDTIVSLNIIENFCRQIPVLEAQICYTFQSMMENVHSESYSMMIDTYISDPFEKDAILHSVTELPSVRRKMQFAEKYRQMDDSDAALAHRLMAFVIVEGLFFSTSFAIIFWFKQKNTLQALTTANTFIARDEGMHVKFGALLYGKMPEIRLSPSACDEMFLEAIAIEKQFVNEMIESKMLGMNVDLMCQYVDYVADTLRNLLGYSDISGVKNPFSFMDLLGMDGRDNFFEGVPTQYRRSTILNENTDLEFNEEF